MDICQRRLLEVQLSPVYSLFLTVGVHELICLLYGHDIYENERFHPLCNLFDGLPALGSV